MPSHQPSRRELEDDYWRERLRTARITYEQAVAQFRRVLAEQRKWPLPEPEGSAAVRKSRLQESAARNEYMRVHKIFTNLTLHGKTPEE